MCVRGSKSGGRAEGGGRAAGCHSQGLAPASFVPTSSRQTVPHKNKRKKKNEKTVVRNRWYIGWGPVGDAAALSGGGAVDRGAPGAPGSAPAPVALAFAFTELVPSQIGAGQTYSTCDGSPTQVARLVRPFNRPKKIRKDLSGVCGCRSVLKTLLH